MTSNEDARLCSVKGNATLSFVQIVLVLVVHLPRLPPNTETCTVAAPAQRGARVAYAVCQWRLGKVHHTHSGGANTKENAHRLCGGSSVAEGATRKKVAVPAQRDSEHCFYSVQVAVGKGAPHTRWQCHNKEEPVVSSTSLRAHSFWRMFSWGPEPSQFFEHAEQTCMLLFCAHGS